MSSVDLACFAVISLVVSLPQEFYGPQFAVYKDGSGRGLGDILADLPDEKGRLVSNMKNALVPLVHKLDFGRCKGKWWYRKSLNKSRGVYFLSKVFKKASI